MLWELQKYNLLELITTTYPSVHISDEVFVSANWRRHRYLSSPSWFFTELESFALGRLAMARSSETPTWIQTSPRYNTEARNRRKEKSISTSYIKRDLRIQKNFMVHSSAMEWEALRDTFWIDTSSSRVSAVTALPTHYPPICPFPSHGFGRPSEKYRR